MCPPDFQELLSALTEAHGDRLAALAQAGKFPVKRHLRAERKVVELSFGLRRWRLQR